MPADDPDRSGCWRENHEAAFGCTQEIACTGGTDLDERTCEFDGLVQQRMDKTAAKLAGGRVNFHLEIFGVCGQDDHIADLVEIDRLDDTAWQIAATQA